MTMMPGKIWCSAIAGKRLTALPTINKSLGEVLAGGHSQGSSDEVIDQRLRPHLELILDSEFAHVKPFKPAVKNLLQNLDLLKNLLLWITHYDLNEMNVMLGDDFQVSGLIDWQLSFPRPFGIFLGRIHPLAGEYSEGEFYMSEVFEEAERALWQALYAMLPEKAPPQVVKTIADHSEVVQLAVMIGTILDVFQLDDRDMMENPGVATKALPKFLSYRIPAIRGDEPPYTL